MRFRPLPFVALLACAAPRAPLAAQVSDATRRPSGATVSGVVRDSIARAPLAGAFVQLIAGDTVAGFARSALSDSLGRFAIRDVPDGRYALGFFHPMLDSLGVELPTRTVIVSGRQGVRLDLALPSPTRLRAIICGTRPAPDTSDGGLLMGIVRGAREGAPAAGVTVTGEWIEFTVGPKGVDRRRPRLMAKTAENGWYAMCNVPSDGTMFVTAGRGADSTTLIEVQVPREGFLRRDLYLGRTGTAVPGDGNLRGTVVTVDGNRPLAGALVRIADGAQVRADEHGDWTLADVPVGTRMLEVRAIGFFPANRPVDIVAGAPPVRVALSTLKAVLDTVRITASRSGDRSRGGFEERRRTGTGRYLTAEQIGKFGFFSASEVLRGVPGVRINAGQFDRVITVRRSAGDNCSPSTYIDGIYMFELSADEIDAMVQPQQIKAMEVYVAAFTPPQFQRGFRACGAIVIWTK